MKRAGLSLTLLLAPCSIASYYTGLASALSAVTRPPVPASIPFAYDPNLCPSPVMDWIVAEPNETIVYAVGVHNRLGMVVNLAVTGTAEQDVLIDRVGTVEDPADGWNQYFQFAWTPPAAEAIHYVEITATDLTGRQDSRTLLVYAVYDDAPFIFPVRTLPVSRIRQAQRLVQVAKKVNFPMTKPIQVK